MLDRNRPYAQIIGESGNGARYAQDGKEFDHSGNEIAADVAAPTEANPPDEVIESAEVEAPQRKRGRPRKDAS
jgi:hypothetical protein